MKGESLRSLLWGLCLDGVRVINYLDVILTYFKLHIPVQLQSCFLAFLPHLLCSAWKRRGGGEATEMEREERIAYLDTLSPIKCVSSLQPSEVTQIITLFSLVLVTIFCHTLA